MPAALSAPRIVIATTNANGRSDIASDAPVTQWRSVAERPGYRVSDIWALFESPAPLKAPSRVSEHRGLLPPKNGNVLRILDYPPEPSDPVARQKMFDALFTKLFPDGHDRPAGARHPGMHATDTFDYAIVLAGEIYAVMEEREVLLRTGDILVQCGSMHAWSNRSDSYARLAVVLIDATR
jgi:hypothetical protein